MKEDEFTAEELVRAVELSISKEDLRYNPELCMEMLDYFALSAKDIREILNDGKRLDFTAEEGLGLVNIP